MVSPNIGSTGVHAPTTRECLVQLNKLVPKSVDSITQLTHPQKAALQGKIAELLQQVLSNEQSFAPEQRTNLTNIRDLAKRAEQMHLLSKPAKAAIKGIAAKTKEIGLLLHTAPLDFTIHTKEGPVAVNSDVLKANSSFFKKMIKSGMKESETGSVKLDISKKTVEFLMKCLHAPTPEKIDLPADNDLVFELVEFALSHGFDNLIKKLEPAVSQFIDQQRATVVENGYAWVNVLKEGSYHATAAKWLADLTPLFLDNLGIPAKPSELPKLFEIPIEHLNALFAEETRDLLKQLPLVLDITDKKDLDFFKEALNKTKLESPLPIKLLCRMKLSPDDEKSLHQLAEASNIELGIEKIFIPPGTVVFGKELWDRYLGQVDDVPLPPNIGEVLERDFIMRGANGKLFNTGKKWKDKFMLVLIPKTVKGEPLTLNRFRDLAQHPEGGGHAANYANTYAPILTEHGNKAVERSEWILMSMKVLVGSNSLQTYEEQEAMVAAIPGCEVPDLLSAHVGILTHFIHTGERFYGKNPVKYTRCKETIEGYQTVVGGAAGLAVYYSLIGTPNHGVGALRKFS